ERRHVGALGVLVTRASGDVGQHRWRQRLSRPRLQVGEGHRQAGHGAAQPGQVDLQLEVAVGRHCDGACGAGGSGGVAWLAVGARSLVTSSLVPTICLSMKSWLRSKIARVSAATTALRLRVSSLSCCCSPDRDQLVEPLTVYTPSTITIFRCEIALCTELVPMAMLLPKASLPHLARICFSCAPVAWLRSRLICTKTFASASLPWMILFSSSSS